MNEEDEDDSMLVAYLCGELDETARLRLEQQLAADPVFAARLLELERVDLVGALLQGRAVQAVGPERVTRRRLLMWGSAVAAASAAIAFVVFGRGSPSVSMRCEVRAVASYAAKGLDGYAERLGVPPELRYSGTQRGADRAPGVSADRFLAIAVEREAARSRDALNAPQQPFADGFFTLRLEVDRSCHALVLQLDTGGRWTRRFPSRGEPVFGEMTNPLSTGIHTLPRPVVLANAVGTLSVHPGFELPSDPVLPRTWVILATRERPIEPALMAELDVAAAAEPEPAADAAVGPAAIESWAARRSQHIDAWLVARGFAVSPLSISQR